LLCVFFFQAEDGIRDATVTGVQTCALPISEEYPEAHQREGGREAHHDHDHDEREHQESKGGIAHVFMSPPIPRWRAVSSISCAQIGRASCRERGESSGGVRGEEDTEEREKR